MLASNVICHVNMFYIPSYFRQIAAVVKVLFLHVLKEGFSYQSM